MLVVDAYNVLHVTGVLPPDLAGLEVHELAALVGASRWGRHHAVLVCDGTRPRDQPARAHHHGVAITYAGGGVSADAAIEQMLEASSHPRRMTIVSNDHQVQRAARRRKAHVLTADAWLRQLAQDHARPRNGRRASGRRDIGPLTAEQVDAWLRYFGMDPS